MAAIGLLFLLASLASPAYLASLSNLHRINPGRQLMEDGDGRTKWQKKMQVEPALALLDSHAKPPSACLYLTDG